MKTSKNKILISITPVIALIVVLFLPISAVAQTAPWWLDTDIRNEQYPQATYYTGFSEIIVGQGESSEKALARAKQKAIGELSDRVRVMVSTSRVSTDMSDYNGVDEQIYSKLSTLVHTASQTEVVGSRVESHYDSQNHTAYAFAFVSREELHNYYVKQIALHLNKVEGVLMTAAELAEKGYKTKARHQCEGVIDAFATVAYAQDLLTAISSDVEYGELQQVRSERLRNTLVQTLVDLENSIYLYVECREMVNGQTVVHIGERLPGLLTEQGCGCNFTDYKEEADYVIKVDARLNRCNDAPDNIVFCYATATVSVLNTHTQKNLHPQISETKGGWTNRNRAKATEEAFDELAVKIAEKVIPMIKK